MWDGNHRLSCLATQKERFIPEYVRVVFECFKHGLKNYENEVVTLPKCRKTWPSCTCGCDFGLDTNN